MAVRMKDIAQDLGLSVVTVSKVLRGHYDIGKQTRERVLLRAKELNYRPNLMARSLVTGRSSLIGLVVPDLIHPFFAEIAKALSYTLKSKGYYLVVASSEEDPELECEEIDRMLAHKLDAMVIASAQTSTEAIRRISEQGTPLVLVDRFFRGVNSNFVGTDDYAVGVIATEHLIQVGCKHIAHIRGSGNSVGERRLEGYRDTLLKHGRALLPTYVIAPRATDVDSRQHGAEAMYKLLSLHPTPDGVFCFNDALATGAMNSILDKGLGIPADVAVIGCGNLHYVDSLRVPLSSIDQNSTEIGERTAKLIFNLLDEKKATRAKRVILKPRLAARASTMRQTVPVHH
jgi:LacI family transcriptional regulator